MKLFEEIVAWQKAREFVRMSYDLVRTTPLSSDLELQRQFLRATVSVMSNIAEGFESGSHVEFARYLTYARSSCAEARSLLYAALDQGYITEQEFETAMELAKETKRIIDALRANLRPRKIVSEEVVLYGHGSQ